MLHQILNSILLSLFTEWIEIEDLAYFDSACCSKEIRPFFLKLAEANAFIHNTEILHESWEYFVWLGARCIKIENMSLKSFKNISVFNKVAVPMLKNIVHIKHLEINCGELFRLLVDSYCNKINSVRLLSGHVQLIEKDLVNIFSKIQQLRKLDLTQIRLLDIGKVNLNNILPHCRELEEIDDIGFLWYNSVFPNCPKNKKWTTNSSNWDTKIEKISEHYSQFEKLSATGYMRDANEEKFNRMVKKCPFISYISLPSFDLSRNCVETLVTNCKLLTYLDIANSYLLDYELAIMARNCKSMKHLILADCSRITDVGCIRVAENCLQLETLDISKDNLVTDLTIIALSKHCLKLETINVKDCKKITNSSFDLLLRSCKKLSNIRISGTVVTGDVLLQCATDCSSLIIDNSPSMEYLRRPDVTITTKSFGRRKVSECTFSIVKKMLYNSETYLKMTQLCPQLVHLSLNQVASLTNDTLMAMFDCCCMLESFFITSCDQISGVVLSHVLKGRSNMTKLCINAMKCVTDTLVCEIVEQMPNLTRLEMAQNPLLTNASVSAVIKNCPKLTVFNASECLLIKDRIVLKLIKNCKVLRELHLNRCELLTDRVLHCISMYGVNIRVLMVNKCSGIKHATLMEFMAQFACSNYCIKISCDNELTKQERLDAEEKWANFTWSSADHRSDTESD